VILAFEFNYISQNGVLENLLNEICKDFGIVYSLTKDKTIVTLYVKGYEKVLTNFSNFLGDRLPLSIFFKSSAVKAVVEIPDIEYKLSECTITLPFTPKCLDISKEKSNNPFINNEIGNASYDANAIFLKNDNKTIIDTNESNDFNALYKEVAKLINDGEKIHVNSASGSYMIGKIDETFKDDIKEDFIVIPTDLSVVEKMVVIKDNEIKALASLEKPSMRIRVNSLYSAKEILPTERVTIKLADEILLLNICRTLFEDGAEFLYRVDCEKPESGYSIEIDGTFSTFPQIEVCVLVNGEILIVDGFGYSDPLFVEKLAEYQSHSHAQFASFIPEDDVDSWMKTSCYYLSKTHDDKFIYFSDETGLAELIKFPLLRSYKDIFAAIESQEGGESLIKNYQKHYPELYSKALSTEISEKLPDNVFTMWGIAAVILGISESIEEGSQKILANAEDYGGSKGPRIDYFIQDVKAIKSDFDFVKMIRSAISFKLAGTDDVTLSFGFLESFAYFLVDTTDAYKESIIQSKKVALCGSMFGIKRFTELASLNTQASLPICFNREFPIDH